MIKLILDPKKISYQKKIVNLFLSNFFLSLIKNKKKKINFLILNKKGTDIKNQISQINLTKKIYKNIINELIPKLNNIHNINWNKKTWDFFLGHWLNNYIAVMLDRLYLIKSLIKKKINFNEQIFLGRKTDLFSNDTIEFSANAGRLVWNKKLISRIIYLLLTKEYNNNQLLSYLKRKTTPIKESRKDLFFFNLKIKILKFFNNCLNENKFFFFNSYIKDKFTLFKIFLSFKIFPIPYSSGFFNNKIVKSNFNNDLRKKIELNYRKEKNIYFKIIKFLFIEVFPLIFLEGFSEQKKIADNCHLPKKTKGIFTCSAYADNAFKFWLADKINNKNKIFFGTHGAGYNIFKFLYHEKHELKFCDKYFIWGKDKSSSKMISIGNFLLPRIKKFKNLNFIKILIVLPICDFYKRRIQVFFSSSHNQDIFQIENLINKLSHNVKKNVYIKSHPKSYGKDFSMLELIKYNKKIIKVFNSTNNFEKINNDFSFLIFTYLSTEFLNSISINKPCMIYINKTELKNYRLKAKVNFLKLKNAGILHFSGNSLAAKLNTVSSDIDKWWNSSEVKKIKKNFCNSYCGSDFKSKLFINTLKKNSI